MRSLKEYRTDVLRLSQSEMGDRLGVTGVTYGQWETGKRVPSGSTLQKMAEEFEVIITIKADGIYFTPESEWLSPSPISPDDPALGEDVTNE